MIAILPCRAKGCDGLVLSMNHGTEHLTRADAEALLRDMQIELDHESMLRALGD